MKLMMGISMGKTNRTMLAALFASVALAAPIGAFAATIFDVAAEEMLKQAGEVRQRLNLTANQATLWFKAEARTREILRERQARHERFQAELNAALGSPGSLRDLAKNLAAEDELSLQENRSSREMWLGIDDALDDVQRQGFRAFIRELLARADAPQDARREALPKPAGDGNNDHGGKRGGRGGGMGGSMSGGGMSRF